MNTYINDHRRISFDNFVDSLVQRIWSIVDLEKRFWFYSFWIDFRSGISLTRPRRFNPKSTKTKLFADWFSDSTKKIVISKRCKSFLLDFFFVKKKKCNSTKNVVSIVSKLQKMVMSLWKTRFSYLCQEVTSPKLKIRIRSLCFAVDVVNGYHHHFTRHYVMNWNQAEHCFHFT